jgi:hypothetical protein
MAFNPGIIHRDYLGCLKNIPKTITLQPKKTFVLEDNFKLSDTTINHPLSISTGFKVIKPADDFFLSFFEFDYDPNAEHFTWSKPIIISF